MTPIAVLAALLAVSVLANGWLFHQRDKAIAADARAEQLNKDTVAAAGACTASVDKLAKDGRARSQRLDKALEGIAPAVRAEQEAADKAQRARPDDPKNLCASLERYLQGQIKAERGAK